MRFATSLALALLALATPARAQLVAFQFAPPDGLTFVRTVSHEQKREAPGSPPVARYVVSRSETKIVRKGGGYEMTVRPIGTAVFRDGERIRDPAFLEVANTRLTFALDSDGRVESLTGFEDLHERLARVLPPDEFERQKAFYDPKALALREISEWEGRVARLSGVRSEVGKGWGSREVAPLPTGDSVEFSTGTKIEERTQCGRRICVRLRFSYDTDASAVAAFLGETVEQLPERARPNEAQVAEVEIEGGGERTLDPSTLTIRHEVVGRELRVKVRAPGAAEPVETRIVERKEYTYEYGEEWW